MIAALLLASLCSAADPTAKVFRETGVQLPEGAVPVAIPAKPVAPAKPTAPTLTHTEADAVGWTFDALSKYPPEARPYIRCVYLPAWADPEWIGVVDVAMNSAVSHSRTLVRGDRHANGYLLAYDFRKLASGAKLTKALEVWDGLAIKEAKFHVPEIDQVTKAPVAILAPHLAEALARHVTDPDKSQRIDVLLAQITRGTGAVYPAEFVIEQTLTAVEGKYPEFRQWDFKPAGGITALQNLFKERGYFLESSVEVGGERGALVMISKVLRSPRAVATIPGIGNRAVATITFDFNHKNKRPDARFVRNLIEFPPKHDASEFLIPMTNGLWEGGLANGKGELQRVAPPDVAGDDNKPFGEKELEVISSCIICHGPDDGYRKVVNEFRLIIGSGADYFGDEVTVRGKKLTREQAVDIVVGRYGGEIDEADGDLGRARRDYIRAIDVLTDYPVKADGPSCAAMVAEKIKSILYAYRYGPLGPAKILREQGVQLPDGADAKKIFAQVWPPRPGVEDPLVSLLRNGAEVTRDDADALHVELARLADRKQFAGEGK